MCYVGMIFPYPLLLTDSFFANPDHIDSAISCPNPAQESAGSSCTANWMGVLRLRVYG